MKAAAPALILLLASQAGAQSFVSMGRLFTTTAERAQLDAQRSQAPLNAVLPPAPGQGAAAAPMGMAATSACAPGAAPGCPAGDTAAASGANAAASQESEAQAPPGLRLDGVIRRGNGSTVMIVNGEVQAAPPGRVLRGAVTLQADGRSVVLKPGQRYDPATGEIHEAAR